MQDRIIFHIDMDCYYASIEEIYNPKLAMKPLAIAGDPKSRRGVIVTCNYNARKYGIHSAMSVWEAKAKCKQLIICPPRYDEYRQISIKVFQFLLKFSYMLQVASIDECYLDVTDKVDLDNAREYAKRIQDELQKKFKLSCSIGISYNKFLAKMASKMKKPHGISFIDKDVLKNYIWKKDINEMYALGNKTASKLKSIGILTIGDFAKLNEKDVRDSIGNHGVKLHQYANGIDFRKVDPEEISNFKSMGKSYTFPKNESNKQNLLLVLKELSRMTSSRIKVRGVLIKTIQMTIKYEDFKIVTRRKRLNKYFESEEEINEIALSLFNEVWNGNPVRLLSISGLDIIKREEEIKQMDFFSLNKEIDVKTEESNKLANKDDMEYYLKESIRKRFDIG